MPGFRRAARRRHARVAAAFGAALGALLICRTGRGAISADTRTRIDRNAPVLFQADEVEYDEQLGVTVAKGHVEISQGGEVLLADTVSYNQRTGTITASGHVSLMQPTGESCSPILPSCANSMNTAFAQNVGMLLADRSRLAANAGRRLAGNRTELTRGVYSPCDLCKDNPSAPPLWQFKAREIDHDREQSYSSSRRDARTRRLAGVLYALYFSPGPHGEAGQRLFDAELRQFQQCRFPFHAAVFLGDRRRQGSDAGAALHDEGRGAPGRRLPAAFRQRRARCIASINYSDAQSATDTNSSDRLRGHVNTTGVWHLNETYRSGFDLQRVSDNTYLLRYGFGVPLLNAMISRAYLRRLRAARDDRHLRLCVSAADAGPQQLDAADRVAGGQPQLGQRTRSAWRPAVPQQQSAEYRPRNRDADAPALARQPLGAHLPRRYRQAVHLHREPARRRYSVNNLSQLSNPDLPSAYFPLNGAPAAEPVNSTFLTGRSFPQLGLTWSYPLAHRGPERTALVEPIVGALPVPQAAISAAFRTRTVSRSNSTTPICSDPTGCPGTTARYRTARRLRVAARPL